MNNKDKVTVREDGMVRVGDYPISLCKVGLDDDGIPSVSVKDSHNKHRCVARGSDFEAVTWQAFKDAVDGYFAEK